MVLAATGLAAGAPGAHAAGFLAGAGRADSTPPQAGTAAGDAANTQFASTALLCKSPPFPTQGLFALQEPFNDVNSNQKWDSNANISSSKAPPSVSAPPEPFCDANGNGHWDGIYAPNGKGPADGVHDPLEARAVAISDGHSRPVVYASVASIGLFDAYTEQARAMLKNTYKVDADLIVSANHNESSPDTIGLYGALQTPVSVGLRSGINEYYLSFLADRIAHAAADAVHALAPAKLFANQVQGSIPADLNTDSYPLLTGMSQRISDQFPTSVARPSYAPEDNRPAAVDTKLGVLQARAPNGTPIFTLMSLAAHNQEMGNSGVQISGDWPGAFQSTFDSTHPGIAMFLVGDNGSIEDPSTSPPVIDGGSENHSSVPTQYKQALATGQRFAEIVDAAAQAGSALSPGAVKLTRKEVCVPLENNGFLALAAAGLFGQRQGYVCDPSGNPVQAVPNGFVAPTVSTQFRTFLSYADIGPDLQLIDNPGESFPALMLGSPFGKEQASCDRPNPAVPTWHSHGLYRFQVGLADDLIGYLIPAWGFAAGTPGLFNNDTCYADMNGHRHKLESESVGPTGGNIVANGLASLLDAQKDPSAHIVQGRYVLPDGSYTRWPTGATGILVPGDGQPMDPAAGLLLGSPTTAGFGGRAVNATALFMDYDGQPQGAADVTTRGMIVLDSNGCVSARYYMDEYPPLDTAKKLGGQASQPAVLPAGFCASAGSDSGGSGSGSGGSGSGSGGGTNRQGVPGVQITAAERAGLPVPPGSPGTTGKGPGSTNMAGLQGFRYRGPIACAARIPPHSRSSRHPIRVRGERLRLTGRALAHGCARRPGHIARVTVSLLQRNRRLDRCRFMTPAGRLTRWQPCRQPGIQLLAHGREHWSLRLRAHLPRGRYTAIIRATDTHGLSEPGGRRADVVRVLVR
ncbi:MAG TPA: hypothetical protein VGN69_05625 [Solirubrobacteraceae bacterium]|nr:hypothetical protein [Solirubrobacteraceae bacterium]